MKHKQRQSNEEKEQIVKIEKKDKEIKELGTNRVELSNTKRQTPENVTERDQNQLCRERQ